jgi:hypothetical protein
MISKHAPRIHAHSRTSPSDAGGRRTYSPGITTLHAKPNIVIADMRDIITADTARIPTKHTNYRSTLVDAGIWRTYSAGTTLNTFGSTLRSASRYDLGTDEITASSCEMPRDAFPIDTGDSDGILVDSIHERVCAEPMTPFGGTAPYGRVWGHPSETRFVRSPLLRSPCPREGLILYALTRARRAMSTPTR